MVRRNGAKEHFSKNYSAKALLCACAPIDVVVDTFLAEKQEQKSCRHFDHHEFYEFVLPMVDVHDDSKQIQNKYLPVRYVKNLVQHYIRWMDQNGQVVDDDDLLCMYYDICMTSSKNKKSFMSPVDFPDTEEFGYLSFDVPVVSPKTFYCRDKQNTRHMPKSITLSCRVFPHHNDVGVQKVWEAGCALAEFLLQQPQHVQEKRVLEVGAGVGLTGLVAYLCCGAASVCLTDFSSKTLCNLHHNLDTNFGEYIQSVPVTVRRLDWRETLSNENDEHSSDTLKPILEESDVLLAADVLYDPSDIPPAVKLLNTFMNDGKADKAVIFAYTLRNQNTFKRFVDELITCGISYKSVDPEVMERLPNIFPCYYQQPRSHVQTYILSKSN